MSASTALPLPGDTYTVRSRDLLEVRSLDVRPRPHASTMEPAVRSMRGRGHPFPDTPPIDSFADLISRSRDIPPKYHWKAGYLGRNNFIGPRLQIDWVDRGRGHLSARREQWAAHEGGLGCRGSGASFGAGSVVPSFRKIGSRGCGWYVAAGIGLGFGVGTGGAG